MFSLKKCIGFCFFLFFVFSIQAQDISSMNGKIMEIGERSGLSLKPNTSSDLFLHLNKTVFLTNENIWFAAYLLHRQDAIQPHTLHVVLISSMTQKTISSNNYVLENGMSSGSFTVPDSLQTGDYTLVAYTNEYAKGKDDGYFSEPVQILGNQELPFKLVFTPFVTADSIRITGVVTGENNAPSVGKIAYSIYADGQFVNKSTQVIDKLGKIGLAIRMPENISSIEILGEVSNAENTMSFKLPVKAADSSGTQVLFFPENGKLVDGRASDIYFELKNNANEAVSKKLSLVCNNNILKTFFSDKYGKGIFTVTPEAGKVYQIKIDNDLVIPRQRFPIILPKKSWVLSASDMVTNSLELKIKAPSADNECVLIIHRKTEILYGGYLKIPREEGRLNVPVNEWEEGLAIISLYNKEGILELEKVVLIKDTDPILANIVSDSVSYHQLSKVTLHIKLQRFSGTPVKGIFSFAATSTKALKKNASDIARFYNYARFLPKSMPVPPTSYLQKKANEKHYIAEIQSASRNSFRPGINKNFTATYFDGRVLTAGRPLWKPVELLLAGDNVEIFSTNASGEFILPYKSMRGQPGSKILLSVAKNPVVYEIQMDSPFKKIDDLLARVYTFSPGVVKEDVDIQGDPLFNFPKVKVLEAVRVSARQNRPKGFYGVANLRGKCNDYVCVNNILNCTNHSRNEIGSTVAIDGNTYNTQNKINTIVYHCEFQGMAPYVKSLKASAYPVDPYPIDYSEPDIPEEILNRTALHWQSFITTDANGEATISFYTNNRVGSFTGTIQGIAENAVFTADINFNVVN